MVELPKLYGPYASIIVFQTSDSYTWETDNFDSLSGILGEPKSSTLTFWAGYITEDIAVLQ